MNINQFIIEIVNVGSFFTLLFAIIVLLLFGGITATAARKRRS